MPETCRDSSAALDAKKPEWELYSSEESRVVRMKVDGGWLYRSCCENCMSMVLVPDIDLQRYQAHLRDAFKQGYDSGHADAKRGVKEKFDAPEEESIVELPPDVHFS